jgi:hypothetical protein
MLLCLVPLAFAYTLQPLGLGAARSVRGVALRARRIAAELPATVRPPTMAAS